MKKFLVSIFLASILSVDVLADTTTSNTTTNIDGIQSIDFKHIGLKTEIHLVNGSDISVDMALPILTYTHDSVQWASLAIYTDMSHRVGGEVSVDLVPVNQFIYDKIGKNGSVQLPVLNTLISEYLKLEVTAGGGFDFDKSKPEYVVGLTIVQKNF